MKLGVHDLQGTYSLGRPPRGGRGLKYLVAQTGIQRGIGSPPSRGAWIEMLRGIVDYVTNRVAPLAGGVD